jgi:hypothetical protein
MNPNHTEINKAIFQSNKKDMNKMFALGALLGSMISLQQLRSQETGNDLDPVTLTTSLAPEKTSRTGRNIFVIKDERFSQLPAILYCAEVLSSRFL